MTTELLHATAECVGFWRLFACSCLTKLNVDRDHTCHQRVIHCVECRAEYEASSTARLAMIDENLAGLALIRLSKQGAVMLEGER